jgi:hypothetical protein
MHIMVSIEDMASVKKGLTALYGSKVGKILPVLIIAGLVATASASVYVNYYASATATVSSADIRLVAGSDTSSSSSYAPTVTVAPTNDFASIGISLLPSVTQSPAVQPNIFYTNLLQIHNAAATASHTINAIIVSNIVDANSQLGEIDVYYCTSQQANPVGNTNCAEFSITSTTGGSLTGNSILPQTLAPGATGYIEIVAHAKATATVSDTITFNLQIQWV